MLELSSDGIIQLANAASAELLRLLPHELLQRSFFEIVSSEQCHRVEAFLESIFSDFKKSTCELDLVVGESEIVRVRLEGHASDASRCMLAMVDISEYRQVESRLYESESRFRQLLENTPNIAVQGYDRDRKVIFWNPASETLYGYSREEALGQRLEDLIIPESLREYTINAVETWLESGEGVPASELVLRDKSGQPVTVFSSHCMQVNSRGEAQMFCLDIDLREQKRLEEQLRHSQKMEAVGQLAGGVAHDFNNILTVILGYCSLLKNKLGNDPSRCGEVDLISAAAHRAANLTRSLLSFSRRSPVVLHPRDVNRVISGIQPFLQRLLGEDLLLEVSCDRMPLPIKADQGQLEQVLVNLATNARDAMPKGGTLRISTELRQCHAAIIVQDTGAGMNDETRKRLFEPFYTTKPTGKGTGLGLAIVYGIVKQHEGHIEVDSQPNQGSTFTILLPLTQATSIDQSQSPTSSTTDVGPATILIVEDEAAVQKVVKEILELHGYRVFAANNGLEGVAKFLEMREQIDLVLMDVVMPGMNGPEAADRIRHHAPDAKVLFMSGYTFEVLRDRSGFTDKHQILRKPIETVELLARIKEVLLSVV